MKTAKNIIKELIIFLLLVLAIILILGVLLYEYVPTNKIIPEKVSYTTPENIKSELQTDESVDNTEVVVTYQIDSTDLSNYKKINEYVPGKKNPFEKVCQISFYSSSKVSRYHYFSVFPINATIMFKCAVFLSFLDIFVFH